MAFIVTEYCPSLNKTQVLARHDDYDKIIDIAVILTQERLYHREFFDEIRPALEERGYYMVGWTSNQIRIEEE